MRAIISVSDKAGVTDFAQGLSQLGFEIFSTGGTKKALVEAKVPVKSVSDITGFPEILDGRVKTLHPAVHGGILARRDLPAHLQELAKNNMGTIDLVAVNLYPFVQTVAKEGVTLEVALENIDIGGPTMIRAAAKNFPGVIVVVDPDDYPLVLEKLGGGIDQAERKRLAQKAFQHVAVYDTAISQYLRQDVEGFPEEMTIALKKRYGLRYGENPHQPAAFYAEPRVGAEQDTGITWAKQLWGKELSFNNILDADAAWGAVTDFAAPTVDVIKHTNPCGIASHDDIDEAYRRAFSGDPIAAFGGIVASNRPVTLAMAKAMKPVFYEIVIAPEYEPEALEFLKRKKDLRILVAELPPGYGKAIPDYLDFRRVRGGFLVQSSDSLPEDRVSLRTATRREPTKAEVEDLLFAWRVVKHVKSNAIVLAKDKTLLGMGAGQPSRIVSAQIAREKAGEKTKGSVLASDAMFPFPDVVETAAAGGVTAIIQPGGSIRDDDSIKAADEHHIAMVCTEVRHFRH
ncbi:MAG: bifunctional phosphoribosylaminoimidazolecarboxamide formyltransferase/inosine monophosphate cyclohydrolase [Dehalococcoidales bacterium]|jgi:phosphoribosylaminoimidazolecarboxamide formyltransferase/IMP cyclohydrolase|nr:bifunctional phosphoribosylaminoimidazolecarboxamide formyltransferase/inosine monophosphate cyclohydrolase [Dehalococcoidales bacterium]